MDIITLALAKKYAEEAGSEITPNPAGEPTATLEKIQIEDTVYSLSSNDGGTEYSTTEKKIGTWVDGSDLYMRTFVISNWPSNDWNPINDPSINVLGFVNEVSYFDGTSSQGYHRFSLNSEFGGTTVQFIVHDTAYNYNTTHGNVHVIVTGSSMSYRASVTIIYTKA